MSFRTLLVVSALACLSAGGWALTEEQTEGMDALVATTLKAFTTGDPAVYTLFTTQGSAAVIRSAEGYVATTRAKLKADETVAASFKLPAGLTEVAEERKLHVAGEFIQGRVRLSRDLEGGKKDQWDLYLVALQDGENRSWRYCTLCVTPLPDQPDVEAQQSVVQVLKAWESALTEGSTTGLAEQLNADPLCLGFYTPDGQPWFFTDRDYVVATLDGLVSMGTATASSITELQTQANGPVAAAFGKWHIEVPMFEPMDAGFLAVFIKPEDKWRLVAMSAGPAAK